MSKFNSNDIFIYSLLEFSQFYSMNRLSKVIINLNLFKSIDNKTDGRHQMFRKLNGRLVEEVLPQFKDKFQNYNELLQVLVLSRSFQNQIKSGLDFVTNYGTDCQHSHRYDICIKWSFSQLNLLICSMAAIYKTDKTFFELKTSETFKPKFVDIFYKLKTLKVLSFLAIEPQLPIELLSVVINETFLWTEPTELDVYVMQLHSKLISHFSKYVKDNKAFQTHIREDYFFELKECLRYISIHFHSFVDYLVELLSKTQIDIIVSNFDESLTKRLDKIFDKNQTFVKFFTEISVNPSLMSNEEYLIDFVTQCQ